MSQTTDCKCVECSCTRLAFLDGAPEDEAECYECQKGFHIGEDGDES